MTKQGVTGLNTDGAATELSNAVDAVGNAH
jgi:hypothetical protein